MEQKQNKAKTANGQTAEELTARLPIPGPGRPKDTEIKKLEKKVIKELVKEYKESLADALPQLSPVLISKALSGDIPAIKELHDRVMDRPKQSVDGGEDETGKPMPILVQFIDAKDNPNTPGV